MRPIWKAEAEKAKAVLALPSWSDMSQEQRETATFHTLASFIKRNGLSMKAEHAEENPSMRDFEGDHWKVIIEKGSKGNGHRMTTYFSKGTGHEGREPKLKEVLDCIVSDAVSVENSNSLEDWARDLGYDEDSRKAEKIFKTCLRGAKKLRRLLGTETYKELLFDTERG
jgi:hypothetical protein